jgi:[ribosomal protein S5]-alanine N-acetyltransferase
VKRPDLSVSVESISTEEAKRQVTVVAQNTGVSGYGGKVRAFITSERLTMRPHAPSDAGFMVELNSDPMVVRYTGDVAFSHPSQALEVIASLQRQFAERRLGRLIVRDRETSEVLGWCGLKWHAKEEGMDLGFRFLRRHWNHGFATESAQACLRWLRQQTDDGLGPNARVFANAMEANIGSVRVLEKLGFEPTGAKDADGFLRFELPA